MKLANQRKAEQLYRKWKKFKIYRNDIRGRDDYGPKHLDYLSPTRREIMMDELFDIIFDEIVYNEDKYE